MGSWRSMLERSKGHLETYKSKREKKSLQFNILTFAAHVLQQQAWLQGKNLTSTRGSKQMQHSSETKVRCSRADHSRTMPPTSNSTITRSSKYLWACMSCNNTQRNTPNDRNNIRNEVYW